MSCGLVVTFAVSFVVTFVEGTSVEGTRGGADKGTVDMVGGNRMVTKGPVGAGCAMAAVAIKCNPVVSICLHCLFLRGGISLRDIVSSVSRSNN